MSKKISFSLPIESWPLEHLKENFSYIDYRLISESLDARGANRGKKPKVLYTYEILEHKGDRFENFTLPLSNHALTSKPLIIGAGPAGLFCAVMLAEYGVKSVILEQGKSSKERMKSIAKFWRYGELDPQTNVCFGEGGAGLYSDGKLITRVKSPLVRYVMEKLVEFGAPQEVSYISNPHLGSNKIREIINRVSDWLREKGSEVRYETKVSELLYEKNKVVGVLLDNGEKLFSEHIILASGHSSREMYHHLNQQKVAMEAKDFAMGVRIEHPRELIDQLQYGKYAHEFDLGAARYRLSYHDQTCERGTYSFCMCPGGYVLSSGTQKEGHVVNGMSNYSRSSPWSNAALVVSVKAGEDFSKDDVFSGIKLQEEIEKKAFRLSAEKASGKELAAMTVGDFLADTPYRSPLPVSSSPSKVFAANFKEILPSFLIDQLKKGLHQFNQSLPGFIHEKAILIAPETRTSSPIRILRNKESFESISHQGLYPCGEGAGHAGGITSAAVDGVKIAYSLLGIVAK